MRVPRELEDKVVAFTDAGTWKHSWHWDRNREIAWQPITLKGANQMLQDLGCGGSCDDEIASCIERIRRRYAVADELREIIRKWEITNIADSHDKGCSCEFCNAAGYC